MLRNDKALQGILKKNQNSSYNENDFYSYMKSVREKQQANNEMFLECRGTHGYPVTPAVTNPIIDSKIEATVHDLTTSNYIQRTKQANFNYNVLEELQPHEAKQTVTTAMSKLMEYFPGLQEKEEQNKEEKKKKEREARGEKSDMFPTTEGKSDEVLANERLMKGKMTEQANTEQAYKLAKELAAKRFNSLYPGVVDIGLNVGEVIGDDWTGEELLAFCEGDDSVLKRKRPTFGDSVRNVRNARPDSTNNARRSGEKMDVEGKRYYKRPKAKRGDYPQDFYQDDPMSQGGFFNGYPPNFYQDKYGDPMDRSQARSVHIGFPNYNNQWGEFMEEGYNDRGVRSESMASVPRDVHPDLFEDVEQQNDAYEQRAEAAQQRHLMLRDRNIDNLVYGNEPEPIEEDEDLVDVQPPDAQIQPPYVPPRDESMVNQIAPKQFSSKSVPDSLLMKELPQQQQDIQYYRQQEAIKAMMEQRQQAQMQADARWWQEVQQAAQMQQINQAASAENEARQLAQLQAQQELARQRAQQEAAWGIDPDFYPQFDNAQQPIGGDSSVNPANRQLVPRPNTKKRAKVAPNNIYDGPMLLDSSRKGAKRRGGEVDESVEPFQSMRVADPRWMRPSIRQLQMSDSMPEDPVSYERLYKNPRIHAMHPQADFPVFREDHGNKRKQIEKNPRSIQALPANESFNNQQQGRFVEKHRIPQDDQFEMKAESVQDKRPAKKKQVVLTDEGFHRVKSALHDAIDSFQRGDSERAKRSLDHSIEVMSNMKEGDERYETIEMANRMTKTFEAFKEMAKKHLTKKKGVKGSGFMDGLFDFITKGVKGVTGMLGFGKPPQKRTINKEFHPMHHGFVHIPSLRTQVLRVTDQNGNDIPSLCRPKISLKFRTCLRKAIRTGEPIEKAKLSNKEQAIVNQMEHTLGGTGSTQSDDTRESQRVNLLKTMQEEGNDSKGIKAELKQLT
jgi:hypothetical protein